MYTRFRLVSKSMTLNDLCARFKVIDASNAAKMAKYSLVMTPTPCGVTIEALSVLGLRIHAPEHLLAYLHLPHLWLNFFKTLVRYQIFYITQNDHCFGDWPVIYHLVSWLFSEWFLFRPTAFGKPYNNKRTVWIISLQFNTLQRLRAVCGATAGHLFASCYRRGHAVVHETIMTLNVDLDLSKLNSDIYHRCWKSDLFTFREITTSLTNKQTN